MNALTPRDLVVELLRTLTEAQTSWDARSGGDGPLLMPSLYTDGSYPELERRLGDMREDPEWRPPWWHASHRYRWGWTSREVVKTRRTPQGPVPVLPPRTELIVLGAAVPGGIDVRLYTWPEYVDPKLADVGVDRLVETMYDGDTGRLRLPLPFLWRRLGVPAPDEREGYVRAR